MSGLRSSAQNLTSLHCDITEVLIDLYRDCVISWVKPSRPVCGRSVGTSEQTGGQTGLSEQDDDNGDADWLNIILPPHQGLSPLVS